MYTIFTSSTCEPCQKIKELLDQGKYEGTVELVDIDTDEGFDRFAREVLEHGDGAIPSAYREGKRCALLLDDEKDTLVIDCDAPIPTDQPMPGSEAPSG